VPNPPIDLVFVHGWSVTHTNTYGQLPKRLVLEGKEREISLRVRDIFLGKYISFHDEVRVEDLSKALDTAVKDQKLGQNGRRFYCITHSTGGPVVRDWYDRYYARKKGQCPMSHLVMLAPANFGSALAALGKGPLGRIKSWSSGVEPGQGVLDWLCVGSDEAWKLNTEWIGSGAAEVGARKMFPFVLTGQSIDRSIYDSVNSYTGEMGSDGVVRVAAANLNASCVALSQTGKPDADDFSKLTPASDVLRAPAVPTRILQAKSHSGEEMGIMRSVRAKPKKRNDPSAATVDAILRCFEVGGLPEYKKLYRDFIRESVAVQEREQVEAVEHLLRSTRYFIHDRYSQVIFRLRDDQGHPVTDFDLVLTGGRNSNPNHLPEGFFVDKQLNKQNPETITYYVNYDLMVGSKAIPHRRGDRVGISELGFEVHARPTEGFVHYRKCRIKASSAVLEHVIRPNETTLIDITLTRVVTKGSFRLEKGTKAESFEKTKPGDDIN
jgi:hypothetical protein